VISLQSNGQDLRDILSGAPRISDQLNGVCRSLEFTVYNVPGLSNKLGQDIVLYFNNKRHFEGRIFRRGFTAKGEVRYLAYDPLFYLKSKEDHYIKNMTATQGFKYLAGKYGIATGSLANTGAVFSALYYHAAEGNKVAIDLLARTYNQNGRKYWYRYVPGSGLTLFERVVPKEVWAFQTGVNLSDAYYEESIEDTKTVVKLINRETGKTVTKENSKAKAAYGPLVHFEEVDKDKVNTMDRKASDLANKLSQVKITMEFEGVNPGNMPMFYSGDVIYVQEKYTKIMGAYFIEDITQTYVNDSLIEIGAGITKAPNIPDIQYDDATEKPD
jgi:hypothetical protein